MEIQGNGLSLKMKQFLIQFLKNIIHGSIDKGYKKAESENTFTSVKVSGEKDNTSDMIM